MTKLVFDTAYDCHKFFQKNRQQIVDRLPFPMTEEFIKEVIEDELFGRTTLSDICGSLPVTYKTSGMPQHYFYLGECWIGSIKKALWFKF